MINTIRALKYKWPDVEWEIDDLREKPIRFRKWSGPSAPPTQDEIDRAVNEYEKYLTDSETSRQKVETATSAAIEKIATKAGLSKEEKDALKERTKNEKQ